MITMPEPGCCVEEEVDNRGRCRSGVTWQRVCTGVAVAAAITATVVAVVIQTRTDSGSASEPMAWQGCVDLPCDFDRKRFVYMYDFALKHYAIYDIKAGELAEQSCLPSGHIPLGGDRGQAVTAIRSDSKNQSEVVWWDKPYRSVRTRMIFSDDRGAAYHVGNKLLVFRGHRDHSNDRWYDEPVRIYEVKPGNAVPTAEFPLMEEAHRIKRLCAIDNGNAILQCHTYDAENRRHAQLVLLDTVKGQVIRKAKCKPALGRNFLMAVSCNRRFLVRAIARDDASKAVLFEVRDTAVELQIDVTPAS